MYDLEVNYPLLLSICR